MFLGVMLVIQAICGGSMALCGGHSQLQCSDVGGVGSLDRPGGITANIRAKV